MAKYEEWVTPEGLDQIINWAAKGCNNTELANNMGINRDTLYEWIKKYPDISDAIKKGRKLSVQAIENKFFQTAFGGVEEVTEIVEEKTIIDNKGNEHKVIDKKTTTRKLPPNVTAQIFYLKNHAGYSDNPQNSDDVEDTDSFFKEIGL